MLHYETAIDRPACFDIIRLNLLKKDSKKSSVLKIE